MPARRVMKIACFLLNLWLVSSPSARAQSENGLLGHWPLDENGPDRLVADASASRFHGTCGAATAQCSAAGRLGRAILFPAARSIDLDRHAAALGKLTDFTVSMWIRPENPAAASQLLFSLSNGTMASRIQMEVHQGQLHFGWQNGGPFTGFGTEGLGWTPGTWYHVVFVNDSKRGKSILRSNDIAWKTDSNTLAPADLAAPLRRAAIGSLHDNYVFQGGVDDVRLYSRALSLPEQLAIYDAAGGAPDDPKRAAAKAAILQTYFRKQTLGQLCRRFQEEVAPRLSPPQRQQMVEWLFQAEDDDLFIRTVKEIGWTRQMLGRLQRRAGCPDPSAETAALTQIEQKVSARDTAADVSRQMSLYFETRALKRRVMLRSPEVDFSKIVCVDAPYTHRSPETHGTFHQTEWVHESRFRSEMCASHGAKLLVLEDIAGTPEPKQIAPPQGFGRPVAMLGLDLSFDARRAVFCMKPEDEKAYHVYETALDDAGAFRQITRGGYSDIDPIYLPNGRFVFLSTRADTYAQCGMWARSYIISRCDADGSNIHILSPGSEPDFSPSLLADGRVLFTRWEYIDKSPQRIQSLWTMHPDGTAANTFWGNQSVYPDHLGEGRQIPGTAKVLFTGFGHHDVWHGCIGIVDPQQGRNYPDGLWKVTQELKWPECGDGPRPTPGAAEAYHTAGRYVAYKTPYPLSEELFLVSARTGEPENGFMHSARDRTIGFFKLYLMDIYGNRELIYQGETNILYAQPVRPRHAPPRLPDVADMLGSEKDKPPVRPGVFFSKDIFEGVPWDIRQHAKYLRVVENLPKNYSVGIVHSGGKPFGAEGVDSAWGPWGEKFLKGKTPTPTTDVSWGDSTMVSGPATSLSGPLGVKQVRGTVPIRSDGSVFFEVPPCRMLYFQVLDEHHRCVHTMRSWVSARPGEYRGCVGCHELHNSTSAPPQAAPGTAPDTIQPPPWGVRSLSYVKDIQPIFDRACSACHTGNGAAVGKLDLTLRPDPKGRWGGIFPEPYPTLLAGKQAATLGGWAQWNVANGYLAVPDTMTIRYDTLPPLTCLSPKSRLIAEAMNKSRCGQKIRPDELQMLIAWIDLWAMFRSDDELRAIEDPPADWFPLWTYPPKCRNAARVRTEYAQDEYRNPEDRLRRGEQRHSNHP